ncbi:alpha/beta hydrolase [Luteolibacter arcticus]|uniref:Alpha/beta hydrolase n=1 Tax=Luteolibacter arcticus TaxID=1581411 RepID=A0ABT3GSD2_9BACT|nr:alpha/beta hydrolase [Luteolibacter arcticus]MCW1926396.1 alpha/beta hydrolase [Luteolibacter arcticus]
MPVLERNNVSVTGQSGATAMLFAHGFGCDQNMWRFVAPAFEDDHRIVLFDHVGAGHSDHSAFRREKYATLDGYADDIVEIGRELGLQDAIFVGHSVSAVIGIIAALKAPGMFSRLILVAPSPCYINDEDGSYIGGFTRAEIEELLDALDKNHMGWSMNMAPVIMGNPERKELSDELSNSFCRTNPEIAKHFARTTFLTDARELVGRTGLPALILQCSSDVIAPLSVGSYLHQRMPGSTLVVMQATGHCPNLSAPEETIAAIRDFL